MNLFRRLEGNSNSLYSEDMNVIRKKKNTKVMGKVVKTTQTIVKATGRCFTSANCDRNRQCLRIKKEKIGTCFGQQEEYAKVCRFTDKAQNDVVCELKPFNQKPKPDCEDDADCPGFQRCDVNILGKDEKKVCSGTVMYLNAISEGHIEYLLTKSKKLKSQEDGESQEDSQVMIKKIQTEKIASMSQHQKYQLFSNQLGGTFTYLVTRIKWSFHRLKYAVIAVRDAFSVAMEDGKIDENEANEITIKSLMVFQYSLQSQIYIRRAERVNLFITQLG